MVDPEWSAGVVLVCPSGKADIESGLQEALELVRKRGDCNVIVDCAALDILNSHHLTSLLRIQKLLHDCGHQLVLCCVREVTQRILSVTGLTEVFDIADDRSDAMVVLETGGSQTTPSDAVPVKGLNA